MAASDGPLKLVEGLSNNLSFLLPEPWGAAVNGISGLMDLFGVGGSGEDIVKEIGDLIDQAVSELEGYMRQLNIEKADGDAAAFFEWYKQNLHGRDNQPLTDASVNIIETELLPQLVEANSFATGSLLNDLVSFSSDTYVTPDTPMTRDQDTVLTMLLTTFSALIAALKLSIRLHAAVASFYAPVNGQCLTADDDEKFQDHTTSWLDKTASLVSLIGNKPADPPHWPEFLSGIGTNWSATQHDDVINEYYSGTRAGGAGCYPSQLPSFSVGAAAGQLSWAGALRNLIIHRVFRHLRALGFLPYPDDMVMVQDTSDSRGRMYGGPSNDRPEALYEAVNGLGGMLLIGELLLDQPPFPRGPGYLTDLGIVDGWFAGLQSLVATLPPDAQQNTAVISGWATDSPATNSLWLTAKYVQYAFSYLSPANGPSSRNAWSAETEIAGRWKPTLQKIVPANGDAKIQVWRRFIYPDRHGEIGDEGIPKIVATLPGATTEYVDNEPALPATA